MKIYMVHQTKQNEQKISAELMLHEIIVLTFGQIFRITHPPTGHTDP